MNVAAGNSEDSSYQSVTLTKLLVEALRQFVYFYANYLHKITNTQECPCSSL